MTQIKKVELDLSQIYWGEDTAELDKDLLNYFVPPAELSRLERMQKSIIVGRKGSGKSAIRKKLIKYFSEQRDYIVFEIIPTNAMLSSISQDKNITDRLNNEVFFQYVWMSYLLERALIEIGQSLKGVLTNSSEVFARELANEHKESTLDVLEVLSDLVEKIKLKAGKLGEFGLQIEKEIKDHTQIETYIFHIKKLIERGNKVICFIDDLDLGWDNSVSANQFLLGLLLATKQMKAIENNAHFFIFMRDDMYKNLMTMTQHSDKFRDISRITWDDTKLKNIIEERIKYNYLMQKTRVPAHPFDKVFPSQVGSTNTMNWLCNRTLARPRELIQLCRLYTEGLTDSRPNQDVLKSVEVTYSNWKLDDICNEFSNQYQGLKLFFDYWKANHYRIKYHLEKTEYEVILTAILDNLDISQDWYSNIKFHKDLNELLNILYEIGFVGDFILGGDGGSKIVYSTDVNHQPSFNQIQIHPCFRKAVGTVERVRSR